MYIFANFPRSESLRFLGPITQTQHHAKEDTVIGGKYKITKDMNVRVNLPGMHHDTRVYGEDAAEFRPERMMDGGFEALPPNAWKAFGNGKRSCIGRFLAEQEMVMTVATVLQRFEVSSKYFLSCLLEDQPQMLLGVQGTKYHVPVFISGLSWNIC